MKVLFFDIETTGVQEKYQSIHQIAAIFEEDGVEVDRINLEFAPDPTKDIPHKWQTWAKSNGIDVDAILNRTMTHQEGWTQWMAFLDKHIDKYDKTDKATVCGFNVHFDVGFMRIFMNQYDPTKYDAYGGYFWSGVIDTQSAFTRIAAPHRDQYPKTTLIMACKAMGVELTNAHDGMADIEATRKIEKMINPEFWEVVKSRKETWEPGTVAITKKEVQWTPGKLKQ